jgi:hypothetical protein
MSWLGWTGWECGWCDGWSVTLWDATYWNTEMTSFWDVPMTALWEIPMDTVIP